MGATTIAAGLGSLLVAFFLLGSVSHVEEITEQSLVSELGYQIHSQNDLRQWHQTLAKGARNFKIDPHFMPPEFCKNLDGVEKPKNGCFVLSHDQPTENVTYSTLDDVLDFLRIQKDQPWTKEGVQLEIALCFKFSGDVCANTTNATMWHGLLDSFHQRATALIKESNLPVEFILDGAAKPLPNSPCLKDKWRPWVAVYIWGENPHEIATDGDPSKAYDRFTRNNLGWFSMEDPGRYLREMAAMGYGRFANIQEPYQFWEPSSQQQILSVVNDYVKGPRHAPGFLFAINIDPIKFEVFVGPRTGRAHNVKIGNTVKAVRPMVAVVGSPDRPQLLVAYTQTGLNRHTTTSYRRFTQHQSFNSLVEQGKPTLLDTTDALGGWSSATVGPTTYVLAAEGSTNEAALYRFDQDGSPTALPFTDNPFEPSTLSSMAIASGPNNSLLAAQLFVTGLPDCSIALKIWEWAPNSDPSTTAATPRGSLCPEIATNSKVTSLSVGLATEKSNGTVQVLFAYAATSREMHVARAQFSEGRLVDVDGPSYFGPGQNPSVSMATDADGRLVALITHGDGYCYNSHEHNIRSQPPICDSDPESTPGILAYTYGPLGSLADIIKRAVIPTPCLPHLLIGCYDAGTQPSSTLYLAGGRMWTAATHQGQRPTSRVGSDPRSEGCGDPLPYEGLVLDAWPWPLLPKNY